MTKSSISVLPLLLAALLLAACTTISPFSQAAFDRAVALKVDALALVDKATEPYAEHRTEVADLRRQLDVAYEYAKGRPRNEESTAQWALLRDPNRNLLGGFLKRWEEKGRLSRALVDEAKGPIGDAFDTIIQLESGKRKAGGVAAQQGG